MNKYQVYIFSVISIIVLIAIIYIIFRLFKLQEKNRKFYKSNILAEITTLENERLRIAGDLHDDLGPMLTAIKLKLSSIETHLPEDEIIMIETNKHLDDIVQRIREISSDLMPPSTFHRNGLIFSIDEFIQRISNTTSSIDSSKRLQIDFQHYEIPEMTKDKMINIYRIAQEIIHNTIKHSRATLLTLKISIKENAIIFNSVDNGIGFDYSQISKKNTGLGLRNLFNRTEIMGGEITIKSQIGKGTIYNITIPII